MGRSEGDASLSRQRRSFTVKASPFNAVKLDVALIVIIGVMLVLVHGRLVQNSLGQLALLAGYGVAAMVWIVVRTRRVSRRLTGTEAQQRDKQS
jgi:hypothetical protein